LVASTLALASTETTSQVEAFPFFFKSSPKHERSDDPAPCAISIFDTRVAVEELAPDERDSRSHRQTQRHPSVTVCKSYNLKQSCCTKETLEQLLEWSNAVDSSFVFFEYLDAYARRNPKGIIDKIFAYVAQFAPPVEHLDYNELRKATRDELGLFVNQSLVALGPEMERFASSVLTYQEGLLCSACEPRFERYLNSTSLELRVRPSSAKAVSDRFLNLLQKWDIFLFRKDTLNLINRLVSKVCKLEKKSALVCNAAEVAANVVLTRLSGKPLREALCGKPEHHSPDLPDANDVQCQQVIHNYVLKGLVVDPLPILKQGIETLANECSQSRVIEASKCDEIKSFASKLDGLYATFDTRPLVKNVYADDGYDVSNVGCGSNLSGFACDGDAPRLRDQGLKTCARNWPTMLIIGLLALAVIGLGISNYRSMRKQNDSRSMLDGSSVTQPMMGGGGGQNPS
jgi:hypothetical protein